MSRETGAGSAEGERMEWPVWSGDAGDDPRIVEARRRWRAEGDRLWPVALSDGESYRQVAHVVGALLDDLRERTASLEELVELEAAPDRFLEAVGEAGSRATAQPGLLAAACAVRGDELAAERARGRRAERIAGARAAELTWVEVERSPTRVVEMHLATGTAIVATADPYLGEQPFRIAEGVLDTVSGDTLSGDLAGSDDDAGFATAADWEAERERRRREISERLDTRERDSSDR